MIKINADFIPSKTSILKIEEYVRTYYLTDLALKDCCCLEVVQVDDPPQSEIADAVSNIEDFLKRYGKTYLPAMGIVKKKLNSPAV